MERTGCSITELLQCQNEINRKFSCYHHYHHSMASRSKTLRAGELKRPVEIICLHCHIRCLRYSKLNGITIWSIHNICSFVKNFGSANHYILCVFWINILVNHNVSIPFWSTESLEKHYQGQIQGECETLIEILWQNLPIFSLPTTNARVLPLHPSTYFL